MQRSAREHSAERIAAGNGQWAGQIDAGEIENGHAIVDDASERERRRRTDDLQRGISGIDGITAAAGKRADGAVTQWIQRLRRGAGLAGQPQPYQPPTRSQRNKCDDLSSFYPLSQTTTEMNNRSTD